MIGNKQQDLIQESSNGLNSWRGAVEMQVNIQVVTSFETASLLPRISTEPRHEFMPLNLSMPNCFLNIHTYQKIAVRNLQTEQ